MQPVRSTYLSTLGVAHGQSYLCRVLTVFIIKE